MKRENQDCKLKQIAPFASKIWLSSPTMHGDEIKYITEAYESNWMSTVGKNINEVERLACEKIGCRYAVALSAGTAALHMAVRLAGVKSGDKVFCSDMTFDATVNPVVYEGGIPVFIDTEYDTWNMDPIALEKAFEIYPDVKVVVVAHLYGTPGKIEEIQAICRRHNAIVIEDAAEFNNNIVALGSFKDDVISVTFNNPELVESNISLYTFDIAKLEKLCSDYNANYSYTVAANNTSLKTTVTASGSDKMFFVPVPYDKGWSASVNGKQVKASPAVNDGFMAVPLENGVNEIVLSYHPNGMKTGIAVSVITVALAAFAIWMKKKTKISGPPKPVAIIANWALYAVWIAAIVGVYIVPMIYGIFFSK